ncbi:MAG: hypothetical protein PF569_09270 [Candidatus Woesearchaeota archaeon]|jgi:ribonucleoside-triphosphate reductase|nr:hypothetical protein [Candidatus Woesearchaeota archaeon]
MNKGKKFLSDLKLHSDYLKWRSVDNRFETWEEACENILDGHRKKYSDINIEDELTIAKKAMSEKRVLASQRNLQYRYEQIEQHNTRLYNCSSLYAARNEIFQEAFYLSLCGCGVGVSLLKPFVKNISKIQKRTSGTITYVVEDSIEGWADSLGVLMSSYFEDKQPFPEYAGFEVKFDFSEIRQKGSFISGGFKAPGSDGLKQSLERIEQFLNSWIETKGNILKPIAIFDILCITFDAVLSGGLRRAAMNAIVDPSDDDMIYAKTGDWRNTHPHRARSNNSVLLIRELTTKEDFEKLIKLNEGSSDIGFAFANSWFDMFNPCFEILMHPILHKQLPEEIKLNNIKYNDLFDFIRIYSHLLGVSFCNLSEINAELITNKTEFLEACEAATIIGTLQAGYNQFSYFGKITEDIVKQEALIGVSITGWMNNLMLFDPILLQEGAALVKDVNKRIAKKIEINQAARTTCVNFCAL